MSDNRTDRAGGRHTRMTAVICAGVVAGMVGLAYASVPLYRLFCQVTGYGGTPKIVAEGSSELGERSLTIRFDASTASEMPWKFAPVEHSVTVRLGETTLAFYRATNPTSRTVSGTATYNVVPVVAAAYFNKIDCFCFTEQTLGPGAGADMPVSFYVDPEIDSDPDVAGIDTITLSYTFFPAEPEDAELDARRLTGEARVN